MSSRSWKWLWLIRTGFSNSGKGRFKYPPLSFRSITYNEAPYEIPHMYFCPFNGSLWFSFSAKKGHNLTLQISLVFSCLARRSKNRQRNQHGQQCDNIFEIVLELILNCFSVTYCPTNLLNTVSLKRNILTTTHICNFIQEEEIQSQVRSRWAGTM